MSVTGPCTLEENEVVLSSCGRQVQIVRSTSEEDNDNEEENDTVSIVTPPKPICVHPKSESSPSSVAEMKNLPQWLMPLELEDVNYNHADDDDHNDDDSIISQELQSLTSRRSFARSVSFADSIVTDIRTTPRYDREEVSKMFYSRKDIERLVI